MLISHESTATAMSWVLIELSLAPELQHSLREEIMAYEADDSPGKPQLDSLPKLNAICSETVRLHPAIALTVRKSVCDTVTRVKWCLREPTFFYHVRRSIALAYHGETALGISLPRDGFTKMKLRRLTLWAVPLLHFASKPSSTDRAAAWVKDLPWLRSNAQRLPLCLAFASSH